MTVVQFIKKFGWDELKELYKASLYIGQFNTPSECMFGIKKTEIKQLVDAYELVASYGGLIEANDKLSEKYLGWSDRDNLQKAIELVESVDV